MDCLLADKKENERRDEILIIKLYIDKNIDIIIDNRIDFTLDYTREQALESS